MQGAQIFENLGSTSLVAKPDARDFCTSELMKETHFLKIYYGTPFENPVLSGTSGPSVSGFRVSVLCQVWDIKEDELGQQYNNVISGAYILRLE
jgi:hypothetical protein